MIFDDFWGLLLFGISILLTIPAFILFWVRMFKDPISTWQGFLIMVFSLIINQVFFHLAKHNPWELFRYTKERFTGSWAHQTKYIEVYETSILGYEFIGMLLFFISPLLIRLAFRKLLDNTVPKTTLLIIFPIYLLATSYCGPSYEFVKKIKIIEVRDNF